MAGRGKTIDVSRLSKKEREKIIERRERSREWHRKNKLLGKNPAKIDDLAYLNATAIERIELLSRELKATRLKETLLVAEIRQLVTGQNISRIPQGKPSQESAA